MTQPKKKFNITEKITFAFGIVIIFGVLSFLVYQLLDQEGEKGPPQLVISSSYESNMFNKYAFKVEVENLGEETAKEANIHLSLYQEGKEAEKGTINISYVPVKSKETAWIVFQAERKSNDSLVVSSVSFLQP